MILGPFPLAQALLDLAGLRFMRDPTRGGLVKVIHDTARAAGSTIWIEETAISVRDQVRGVCDMLGYNPLYLACEGCAVAAVSAKDAPRALKLRRSLPDGEEAAVIGRLSGWRGRARHITDRDRRRTPREKGQPRLARAPRP